MAAVPGQAQELAAPVRHILRVQGGDLGGFGAASRVRTVLGHTVRVRLEDLVEHGLLDAGEQYVSALDGVLAASVEVLDGDGVLAAVIQHLGACPGQRGVRLPRQADAPGARMGLQDGGERLDRVPGEVVVLPAFHIHQIAVSASTGRASGRAKAARSWAMFLMPLFYLHP